MRLKRLLLFGSSICLLLLTPVSALAANNTYVAPFNPGSFTAGIPSDTDSTRIHAILKNTNKYALTTWWNTKYAGQTGAYLNFGGTSEEDIRGGPVRDLLWLLPFQPVPMIQRPLG